MLSTPADFEKVAPLKNKPNRDGILFRLYPGETREHFLSERNAQDARDEMFADVCECVVRQNGEQVRQLLLLRQGRDMVGQLIPALKKCTPPSAELSLSRDDLVGLLAWTYVRLSLAAQNQAGKPHA